MGLSYLLNSEGETLFPLMRYALITVPETRLTPAVCLLCAEALIVYLSVCITVLIYS